MKLWLLRTKRSSCSCRGGSSLSNYVEEKFIVHNQNREVGLMQAYCMKCRAKREMRDAKAITMKNGKPATQGVCPACGTKMFRIGKS